MKDTHKRILELKAQGNTAKEISLILKKEGFKRPKKNSPYGIADIYGIIGSNRKKVKNEIQRIEPLTTMPLQWNVPLEQVLKAQTNVLAWIKDMPANVPGLPLMDLCICMGILETLLEKWNKGD